VEPVTDLRAFSEARHSRIVTATRGLEQSQHIYERIIRKAAAGRRRALREGLANGLSVDQLAEIVGLEVEYVEAIVGRHAPPSCVERGLPRD
jgi:hypothetical protein